jgi:hypothetical protein
MRTRWLVPLLAVLVGACQGSPAPAGDDDDPPPDCVDAGDGPTDGPSVVRLAPVEQLVRVSMALRGVRPSLDDLDAVRASPDALPGLVDAYLETPEFGATMRDLHNEALLTRNLSLPATGALAGTPMRRLQDSIGEEPLRLVEHVIMEDRPYTEIVTGAYTMADPVVARAYGLPYDPAGPAWQETHYGDGRPEAGILSSTTYFLRHISAGANWNRGRANAVANALLCYDFLDRDVTIDTSINLADPEVVRDAVVANAACASCHQTLDPLASFFWGFKGNQVINNIDAYPYTNFDPANTGRWRQTSKRDPAFFGSAGDGLDQLGQRIAEDPRFSMCAARRFYAFMAQTELDAVPLALASRLQEQFIASGYSGKALARAVVLSDEFLASHATDAADAEGLIGLKTTRPEQLARLYLDLTGFRWETDSTVNLRGSPLGRVDLTADSLIGFTVLAGGIDSDFVITPSHTPNATSSLFLRSFAAGAAGYVVTTDFAQADHAKRHLLDRVDAGDRGEAAVRKQLVRLFARLYGQELAEDDAELDATWTLFADTLARTDDVRHAWKTTLTAMLQDLRIATF